MAPPRPPDKVLQLQTRRGRYLREVFIEENITVLIDYVTYKRLAEINSIDRGKVKSVALRLENLKKAHDELRRFGVKVLPDFMPQKKKKPKPPEPDPTLDDDEPSIKPKKSIWG